MSQSKVWHLQPCKLHARKRLCSLHVSKPLILIDWPKLKLRSNYCAIKKTKYRNNSISMPLGYYMHCRSRPCDSLTSRNSILTAIVNYARSSPNPSSGSASVTNVLAMNQYSAKRRIPHVCRLTTTHFIFILHIAPNCSFVDPIAKIKPPIRLYRQLDDVQMRKWFQNECDAFVDRFDFVTVPEPRGTQTTTEVGVKKTKMWTNQMNAEHIRHAVSSVRTTEPGLIGAIKVISFSPSSLRSSSPGEPTEHHRPELMSKENRLLESNSSEDSHRRDATISGAAEWATNEKSARKKWIWTHYDSLHNNDHYFFFFRVDAVKGHRIKWK